MLESMIIATIIVMVFDVKFDWDSQNKQILIWYSWFKSRKYIIIKT